MPHHNSRGYTILEIVIVIAVLCVLAAIGVPMLLRAKQAGNEASAVGSLRAVLSAQQVYAGSCGGGYFAPDLVVLHRSPAGGNPFLGDELGYATVVVKASYTFTMGSTTGADPLAPASCNGQAAGANTRGFWVTATPTANAGDLAFGANGAGAIYEAAQQTALAMTDSAAPASARQLNR